VSTDIAIFMTVAVVCTNGYLFFLYHLIKEVIKSTKHWSQLGTMFSIILSIEGGILNSLFWITKLLTCPYSTFYTHKLNKLTWGTSIRPF